MTTRLGRDYKPSDPEMSDNDDPASGGEIGEEAGGASPMAMMQSLLQQQQAFFLEHQEAQRKMMAELLDRQREETAAYKKELEELTRKREEHVAKPKPPKPTLQKLAPEDDIENFISAFERIATQQGWTKDLWGPQLAGLLTGKARAAYTSLCAEDAADYSKIKYAIFQRYEVNEETHRRRFRRDRKKEGESYLGWSGRLRDYFDRWKRDTTMSVEELILVEQFLQCVPEELAIWIRERKPESLKHAATLADDYALARTRGTPEVGRTPAKPATKTTAGDSAKSSSSSRLDHQSERTKTNARGDKQCFHCRQWGHLMFNCPNRREPITRGSSRPNLYAGTCTEMAWNTDSDKYVRRGRLNGNPVRLLLDTGSTLSMVRADSVQPEQVDTQKKAAVRCVHGDSVEYPTAVVQLQVGDWEGSVRVAVAPELPVPVLLGKDVFQETSGADNLTLLVETRAQRKRREAEHSREEEKGPPPSIGEEVPGMNFDNDLFSNSQERARLSRAQKRRNKEQYRAAAGVPERGEEPRREEETNNPPQQLTPVAVLQATPEEIQQWQEQDPTLQAAREAVGQELSGGARFYRREGLLYRHWHPKDQTEDGVQACEQLVLPECCRQTVLQLAHDIPMAGHLGVTKTTKRVLQRYFWPGVFKDVSDYCKTCKVCQKSQVKRPARAQMVPMPLVQKPFQRIAMDLVGPLPRSKNGNRFILTICDYATRYPEAIPLPSTETPRIAKELLKIFTRVGVPEEVLTDQGANFMSGLLGEIYRILQIKRIRTTPYHPQTDGLVERFNGTLKSMIKKFTSKNKKDWDEYLPYLLFAYREVPQESTGFSPFEMLYGRRVRGPLDVLREGWTGEQEGEVPTITHVVEIRERMAEMTDLVQQNAEQAQNRQRKYYDRGAKNRKLECGDRVLVLLPKQSNKLKLEWVGPFQVIRQVTPVDYEVETPGKRQEKKVYHINLLKKWNPAPEHSASALLATIDPEQSEEDSEFDLNLFEWTSEGTMETIDSVEMPDLTPTQKQELAEVVKSFQDVFNANPGRTSVSEHHIHVAEPTPIRQKPYRLPYSRREVVEEEVQKMLEARVIRPSCSPWASPIVLVEKKDGTVRFCVDYRKVNSVTKFDAYPMPRIEEVLESIGSAKVISTLDLAKGYWQIPLSEDAKEKTAFITPSGLYEFEVMPFGLHSAPATFQRTMNHILRGCEQFAGAYIDDVVIYSQSWGEHLQHLSEVFEKIQRAGLTVKVKKCQFGRRRAHYLGHIIGGGKIRPDPEKVKAVMEYPEPKTKKDVRAFLGLVGYYRRFIPNFATISVPLTNLTRKSHPKQVTWTSDCDKAFQELKTAMVQATVLKVADPSKPFVLQTDASEVGLGAVLSQKDDDGNEHPVAYASRKLLPREVNYATIEKECLAIVWALRFFYTYLYGQSFTVETDHQPLSWLHRMKNTNSRLIRWALALQPFNFSLKHRKGVDNANADGLSRGSIPTLEIPKKDFDGTNPLLLS